MYLLNGIIKEHGILRHHPDRPPQRFLRDGLYVLPVYDDGTRLDIIEPEQKPYNGTFPATRRPHLKTTDYFHIPLNICYVYNSYQSHGFSCGYGERHVLQDEPLRQIPESDVVELDGTTFYGDGRRARSVDHFLLLPEQVEHVLHVDEVLLYRPG